MEINYDKIISLSDESKQELNWWIKNVRMRNGKRIRPKTVNITCRTDASLSGWGSVELNTGVHAIMVDGIQKNVCIP